MVLSRKLALVSTLFPAVLTALPIQVHVHVQPPSPSSAPWNAYPGVVFRKEVTCMYSTATVPSTVWPVPEALRRGGGAISAPLFNPGLPKPDGTYAGTADDGFNTIFINVNIQPGFGSVVCQGNILANNKSITLQSGNVTAKSAADISKSGPPTVNVQPDLNALAKMFPATPAAKATPAVFKSGFLSPTAGQFLNLDQGTVSNTDGDLWFITSSVGNIPSLASRKLATMSQPVPAIPGKGPPDYAACAAASYSTQNFTLASTSVGGSVCVRTNEGRIALITVEDTHQWLFGTNKKQPGTSTIEFKFTTWANITVSPRQRP